jgi:hypothetical protein
LIFLLKAGVLTGHLDDHRDPAIHITLNRCTWGSWHQRIMPTLKTPAHCWEVEAGRMRQTDSAIASRSHSLPYDLVHSHIIPDILSEHLHLLLVAPAAPCWHAFYTLPLVSFSFHQTCRSLWVTIFGLTKDENPRYAAIYMSSSIFCLNLSLE